MYPVEARRTNLFVENPAVQDKISRILEDIYQDTGTPPSSTCTTALFEKKMEEASRLIEKMEKSIEDQDYPAELIKRTVSKAEEMLKELKDLKTVSIEEDELLEKKQLELDEIKEDALKISIQKKSSTPQAAFDRSIERISLPFSI